MRFASFNIGETKIEIVAGEQMAGVIGGRNLASDAKSQSKFFLSFAVDQVDEVCARLKVKGVLFLNEPHDLRTGMLEQPIYAILMAM